MKSAQTTALFRVSSRHVLLCLAAAAALAAATPGAAETEIPTISGRISDATGLPVQEASVTLLCPDAAAQKTVTDAQGNYHLSGSLRSHNSTCRVRVEHEGFTPFQAEVTFAQRPVQQRDVLLTIEPVSGAITVSETVGYVTPAVRSATRTETPLRDIPQSISVVNREQIEDQLMSSIADAMHYVPGVMAIQGENNRDQLVIRGNSTSADFFLDGIRDDVQYYRDLYNVESVEVLKGPNAMVFGRGGGGGVVNRVAKQPAGNNLEQFSLTTGSYGDKRGTLDVEHAFSARLSGRLNGMYEDSGSFRDHVGLERYGVTPSLAITPDERTRITILYENFHDFRTADRGVPSFRGLPLDVTPGKYFGDPGQSHVRAAVNHASIGFERHWDSFDLHNRTLVAGYDRGYQNFVPGAVNPAGTIDSLSAYNNATVRRNLFNQTDLTGTRNTGRVRHRLLAGMEWGRQSTGNFRSTGYFGSSTTWLLPLDATSQVLPVLFRQSATDADNHLIATVAAGYVQDQVDLSRRVQLTGGFRFDSFNLRYHDNRSGRDLERPDRLLSPRLGLVFKPVTQVSVYGSYSVSWLPSSGDQFSSLTTITDQVRPEKFTNLEAGVKWDLARGLSVSAAVYRLDRTNTRSLDPNDATRIVQTGSQRTNGGEISLTGNITRRWSMVAGYGRQHAWVTSATASAVAGAIAAQVPRQTFTLWNRYGLTSRLSAGFGIMSRSDMFASIDDTVRLPGYARLDAAVYYQLMEHLRVQVNLENLANMRYWLNADNNNNISPGSPRAVLGAITARF